MKLTILTKYTDSSETERLKAEAARVGILCNVLDIKPDAGLREQADECGDVVIWRTSSLVDPAELKTFAGLLKGKKVINLSAMEEPAVRNKFYQQKAIEGLTGVEGIPSFRYENRASFKEDIKKGVLDFPLIRKPVVGAEGIGVALLRGMEDLDTDDDGFGRYLFQPFIENRGDFRVLVIGKKVLYAIKRVAPTGSHINNVARGGSVERVEDGKINVELGRVALAVHNFFRLDCSGVDIIYDAASGKYRFMEINVAPKWSKMTEKVTGLNVAREILGYCMTI